MKNIMLLDVGNTRLKWALGDGNELHVGAPLTYTEENLVPGLLQHWYGLKIPDRVWAASVAGPSREAELGNAVRACFGCDITFVHSVARACGVNNAYAQPQRLGIDRFLALIALHQTEIAPLLLASCGTALTLDVLTPEGCHRGGLIMPSPALMQRALYDNTALQPRHSAQLVALAENTDDAIHSGTWLAAVALVERVRAQTTQHFGAPATLILSGGAASTLQNALGGLGRIEPHLVLRGLSMYAIEHARH